MFFPTQLRVAAIYNDPEHDVIQIYNFLKGKLYLKFLNFNIINSLIF